MLEEILKNIDKIHTTLLGEIRIQKNLKLNNIDAIDFIKNLIINENPKITLKGKNYYLQNDNIIITINKFSYTIITAHLKNKLQGYKNEIK